MRFSSVIGQSKVKKKLIDEVGQGKIGHAKLFVGKPGFGPLPLAEAFVQYIFCQNKTPEDSCGECSSCRKIQGRQHPDVHYSFPSVQSISKTSNPLLEDWREILEENVYIGLNDWIRKIDPRERKPIISVHESEEIVRKLSLSSYEGGYKVMIIWMAENMNQQCANKLLKILEEPPKRTLFILIAESDDMMLSTILSRTQIVPVPKVDHDHLVNYIKESFNINASEANSIAARAEGDIIQAREIASEQQQEDENYKLFVQLMRVCYKKNVVDMMNWAEDIGGRSRSFQKIFLGYALYMCRQSILKNYTENILTKLSEEEEGFLANFARFITGNNIIDFTELFSRSQYEIDRNANGKILFTHLCFQVMRFIHKA